MGPQRLTIGFIGAGTVARALAVNLSRRGYSVTATSSRTHASAQSLASLVSARTYASPADVARQANLIFITTSDDLIATVVRQVHESSGWQPGQGVVHCSGALSLEPLDLARTDGALVGSLHPLQAFADAEQAQAAIRGSWWGLEAEPPLREQLEAIARALDGQVLLLTKEQKVRYHAAAVLASNYMVTLVQLAANLWQSFGVPRSQAVTALLPLLRGTLRNIETLGIPQCLTGPIARGDLGTVQAHLIALAETTSETAEVYRLLGQHTIPIAQEKGGLDAENVSRLQTLLASQ
ncbi:MAG: DUF2520 domain-containing protein [Chloroflexi bacterium]|nr:DUF2520 domain-containing protein [Chloroflexota bacterium]